MAFGLGMVVATVLTVMGTYYMLHTFVLDSSPPPPSKAGGLRPGQTVK